jgi:hypothetical protein
MKKLPDEKELLELLEMARVLEQEMREQCELAKVIFDKYEKRISEGQESQIEKEKV